MNFHFNLSYFPQIIWKEELLFENLYYIELWKNDVCRQMLCIKCALLWYFCIDLFQFLMSDRLHEKCLTSPCTQNKISIIQMRLSWRIQIQLKDYINQTCNTISSFPPMMNGSRYVITFVRHLWLFRGFSAYTSVSSI